MKIKVLLFLVIILYNSFQIINGEEVMNKEYKKAIFAGGCFWCMEPPFEKLEGVVEAISGYSGGKEENPTYKQVSAGVTGHTEVVQVIYDDKIISYEELLFVFWRNIEPTQVNGQFNDHGTQYRSAIFYETEEEKLLAEKTKKRVR